MSFRLSGWQRLGIVASVFWALGAGFVARLQYADEANYMYEVTYNNCNDREKAQQRTDFSVCRDEAWKAHRLAMSNSWEGVAFVALVPIPIGWLLAYTLTGVGRWVKRGFSRRNLSP